MSPNEWGAFGDKIGGIIFFIVGIYLLMCGFGVRFTKTRDTEKAKENHVKYGNIEKILGIVSIVLGIHQFLT